MKKSVLVFSIVILFAALIYYRYTVDKDQDQMIATRDVVDVSVVNVQMEEFTDMVEYVADLEPTEKAAVVPKVPGKTVLEVLVHEGDRVSKGDLLARADNSLVKQDLAKAREAVNVAETNYRTSEKDYGRMKDLYNEDVISRQDFDHSKAQFESALSRLKEARSSLEQLKIMYSYHTVTAPIEGVVSKRLIDPGDTFSQQPAFILYKQKILEASGNVPARAFTSVRSGQIAKVEVDAVPDRSFQGEVLRVSPVIDPATRSGEVVVALPSEGALKPGMYARVTVITGSHDGLSLPGDVVRRIPGTGDFRVFVLSGDKAEERIVYPGSRQDNLVEIVDGLNLNERVISTLSDKVKDGASVEVRMD